MPGVGSFTCKLPSSIPHLRSGLSNLKLFLILAIQISDLFRSVHLLASLSNLLIDVV